MLPRALIPAALGPVCFGSIEMRGQGFRSIDGVRGQNKGRQEERCIASSLDGARASKSSPSLAERGEALTDARGLGHLRILCVESHHMHVHTYSSTTARSSTATTTQWCGGCCRFCWRRRRCWCWWHRAPRRSAIIINNCRRQPCAGEPQTAAAGRWPCGTSRRGRRGRGPWTRSSFVRSRARSSWRSASSTSSGCAKHGGRRSWRRSGTVPGSRTSTGATPLPPLLLGRTQRQQPGWWMRYPR